jgi:transcriptional antiterminator NusG
MKTTWYALAVIAGQEKKTRERILDRLERRNQSVRGLSIIAPEEEVTVRIGNEPKRKRQMAMPGYLLLYSSRIPDESLQTIARVKGVLGFLGGNEKPTPLPPREVEQIIGADVPGDQPLRRSNESLFAVGDVVTIVEGPLSDFSGSILEISTEREEAKVAVEIFGRQTPSAVPLRSLRKG